jgi:hypothetical protein
MERFPSSVHRFSGIYGEMKMELRRMIVAVAASAPLLLFATLAGSQTVDFGANLPAGPVPTGYAGFDWGTGVNAAINSGPDADLYYLIAPAAYMVEFSRTSLFDLNSVGYSMYASDLTYQDTFHDLTTVVSGYRGTTLVKSVTEDYTSVGPDTFTGLNIDGVNKITFSTTDTNGYLDYSSGSGTPVIVARNAPASTFVSQINVSSYTMAPEIEPASAAAALTLLLGGLAVLRGRRGC